MLFLSASLLSLMPGSNCSMVSSDEKTYLPAAISPQLTEGKYAL